ncbi:Crp/Fnr family transcriptional regulator [Solimonas soli]|uniref:Crp/Fnr family transcriptional regulator n=1 Tax=Solimonas soli TaxID=413479 RepID=UPI0004B1D66B|nr:Crp/Fnr family transcriptional regulator [Solimonas soli]
MPDEEARRLGALIEPLVLRAGTQLCGDGSVFEYVHLPAGAVLGLLAPGGVSAVQVALVGDEGMFGAPLFTDLPLAPLGAVVRQSGASYRVSARELRRLLGDSSFLRRRFSRYLYVLMTQIAQVVACTSVHSVEERLARWLLATHDRCTGDIFRLKHQTLADMLGVQRTGISLAAARLRDRGLIRYSRGVVQIVDRAGLEARACACYRWSRELHDRTLAMPSATEAMF